MPHSWLANFSIPGAHAFPKGKWRGRQASQELPKAVGQVLGSSSTTEERSWGSSEPAWVDRLLSHGLQSWRAGGGSHPKHSLPGNWGSRAGPRWLQGHKATIPCASEDSIRNRPTGSQSTPLISGCRESQYKRSMMPESMWQLESDENFICY